MGELTNWRSEESVFAPSTTVTDGNLIIPFTGKLAVSAQITLDELDNSTLVRFWFELFHKKPSSRSRARGGHADQQDRDTIGIYQFVSGTKAAAHYLLS